MKCVLGAPEALFHAHTVHIYLHVNACHSLSIKHVKSAEVATYQCIMEESEKEGKFEYSDIFAYVNDGMGLLYAWHCSWLNMSGLSSSLSCLPLEFSAVRSIVTTCHHRGPFSQWGSYLTGNSLAPSGPILPVGGARGTNPTGKMGPIFT